MEAYWKLRSPSICRTCARGARMSMMSWASSGGTRYLRSMRVSRPASALSSARVMVLRCSVRGVSPLLSFRSFRAVNQAVSTVSGWNRWCRESAAIGCADGAARLAGAAGSATG